MFEILRMCFPSTSTIYRVCIVSVLIRTKIPKNMAEVVRNRASNYKRPIQAYKVAFAGVYDVGKTSLFKRIMKENFSEEKVRSFVEKYTHEEVFPEDEIVIPLEFWDTADLERYADVTKSYYRRSRFVLLVYSAVNESSLRRLSSIVDSIKYDEPAAKLILVRNKIDLPIGEDGVSVDKEEAFLQSMKISATHFWTSAKTNEGVEKLLKQLREDSLKMFKNGSPHTSEVDNRFELEAGDNEKKHHGYGCCY